MDGCIPTAPFSGFREVYHAGSNTREIDMSRAFLRDDAEGEMPRRDYNLPESRDRWGAPGPFYNWGHLFGD